MLLCPKNLATVQRYETDVCVSLYSNRSIYFIYPGRDGWSAPSGYAHTHSHTQPKVAIATHGVSMIVPICPLLSLLVIFFIHMFISKFSGLQIFVEFVNPPGIRVSKKFKATSSTAWTCFWPPLPEKMIAIAVCVCDWKMKKINKYYRLIEMQFPFFSEDWKMTRRTGGEEWSRSELARAPSSWCSGLKNGSLIVKRHVVMATTNGETVTEKERWRGKNWGRCFRIKLHFREAKDGLVSALPCYIGEEYYIHFLVIFHSQSRAGRLKTAWGDIFPWALTRPTWITQQCSVIHLNIYHHVNISILLLFCASSLHPLCHLYSASFSAQFMLHTPPAIHHPHPRCSEISFSSHHPCRAELTLGMRSERWAAMLLLSASSNGLSYSPRRHPRDPPPTLTSLKLWMGIQSIRHFGRYVITHAYFITKWRSPSVALWTLLTHLWVFWHNKMWICGI